MLVDLAQRSARLFAMVVFLAVICGFQKANATEEVIVPGDMPDNCSRGDDGLVTCDGLTKDEFCAQSGSPLEDFCYGGSGGGGGGDGDGQSGSEEASDEGTEEDRDGDSDAQEDNLPQECADEGGEWIDGGCEWPPEEEPEDDNAGDEQLSDEEKCKLGGGRWMVDYCDEPMDRDLTADCSCWALGAWRYRGPMTFPACQAERDTWVTLDPLAVCDWNFRAGGSTIEPGVMGSP